MSNFMNEQAAELSALVVTLLVAITYLVTRGLGRKVLKNLQREYDVLAGRMTEYQKREIELVQKVDGLEASFSNALADKNSSNVSLSSVQAECDGYKTQAGKLEAALDDKENSLLSLRDAFAEVKANYEGARQRIKNYEAQVIQLESQSAADKKEAKAAYEQLENRYQNLQTEHSTLRANHAELKTSLAERDKSHREQVAQFAEQKQALTREFENLANKIFDEKGKSFASTSRSSMDDLLKPFKQQLDGFQQRVNEVHTEAVRGNEGLGAEIKRVLDIGLRMSDDATKLTRALKGDSQQRGAWGEAQLQRTLEMSGLIADEHYETQQSFKDEEGKTKRTDYLIRLPGNKHIVIDSKVSLIAYEKAVSEETPEQYQLAMDEHTKAVKRHIDELSAKKYTDLQGVHSPDYVLMFMPIEAAYIEVLKHSKDLFAYGYERDVILVSHTTLIPILRTVSNLWVLEKNNEQAREISNSAGDLFNKISSVAGHLRSLGTSMNAACGHYNSAVGAVAGNGGLYGKAERFKALSVRVAGTLPQLAPVEKALRTEKLALIAEPIEEDA